MSDYREYNEEQYQMLRLSITDTGSGICLFRSYSPKEQVEIAQRLKKDLDKSCCIFNMAHIETEDLPRDIAKVRKMLEGYEECKVVILCNLQICGTRLGDSVYIQELNHMRDQLLAMNKNWVLGMSPYFAILLSRQARDLYSCIMNHFEFWNGDEDEFQMFVSDNYTGNIRLSLLRFKEYQTRIEEEGLDTASEELLLAAIREWNEIHEYCKKSAVTWIEKVLIRLHNNLEMQELSAKACMEYYVVPKAFYYLQKYEQALESMQMIRVNAESVFAENSSEIAYIDRKLGEIYLRLQQGDKAKECWEKALEYYVQKGDKESSEYISIMDNMAILYALGNETETAIEIYKEIIEKQERRYGKRSTHLAVLWNNIGACYTTGDRMSEALSCFLKAEEIYADKEENNLGLYSNTLKNIGYIYKTIGEYSEAVKYLKKAKGMVEKIDPKMRDSKRLKMINEMLKKIAEEQKN